MKKSTPGPDLSKDFKLFADEWLKEILNSESFQEYAIKQLKKHYEGDMVFKGAQWLAKAEGNIPYIYSTKDPEHKKWNGGFDKSQDLTFGMGHSIKTEEEFNDIKNFVETHSDSEISAKIQQYIQEEIANAVEHVNNFLKRNNVFINQNEFDAVVCLVFNYPKALTDSSDLGRALKSSTYSTEDIIIGFTYTLQYNDKKKIKERVPGLVTRRNNELNLFFNGDYENYFDSKQKIIDADMEWIEYTQ